MIFPILNLSAIPHWKREVEILNEVNTGEWELTAIMGQQINLYRHCLICILKQLLVSPHNIPNQIKMQKEIQLEALKIM